MANVAEQIIYEEVLSSPQTKREEAVVAVIKDTSLLPKGPRGNIVEMIKNAIDDAECASQEASSASDEADNAARKLRNSLKLLRAE